jgi:cholera toxin transcriptional activator
LGSRAEVQVFKKRRLIMSYSLKLKSGDIAIFDANNFVLSITSKQGEISRSTLGGAESRLLSLLLSDPGATKSRSEIEKYVWGDRVVASGSLNQAIFTLRNILSDSRDHEILMTIPRRGYQFNRDFIITEDSNALLVADFSELEEKNYDSETKKENQSSDNYVNVRKFGVSALSIGYIAAVVLMIISAVHFALSLFSPNTEMTTLQQGGITVHLIGNNLNKEDLSKNIIVNGIKNVSSESSGVIWITQKRSAYTVSCMRRNRTTQNMQFNTQENFAEMVQKCLGLPK